MVAMFPQPPARFASSSVVAAAEHPRRDPANTRPPFPNLRPGPPRAPGAEEMTRIMAGCRQPALPYLIRCHRNLINSRPQRKRNMAFNLSQALSKAASSVGKEVSKSARAVKKSKEMLALNQFSLNATRQIEKTAQGAVAGIPAEVKKAGQGAQEFLLHRFAPGVDPDKAAQEFLKRAKQEAARGQRMLAFGEQVVRRLQTGPNLKRFMQDVVTPVKNRQMTGEKGWQALDQILGMNLRSSAQSASGPGWTFGIAAVPEAGMVIGAEGTVGIGGMGKHGTVIFGGVTGGVGAYAKVSFAIEASFSPCAPTELGGSSVGIDIGAAYYAGLTVGVCTPTKCLADPVRFWKLDSINIGVPFGIGVEGALYIDYTWATGTL